MFVKALGVVFCFEEDVTLEKVLKMEQEMGSSEFGRYISELVEKDLYEKVIEEKVQDRLISTPSQVDNNAVSELLLKVSQLLEKGVPISQVTPPRTETKTARAGNTDILKDIENEVPLKPIVPVAKKKKKLGGLRNKENILDKMESMTK